MSVHTYMSRERMHAYMYVRADMQLHIRVQEPVSIHVYVRVQEPFSIHVFIRVQEPFSIHVYIRVQEPFSILPLEAFCNGAIAACSEEMLAAVQAVSSE